MWRSRILNACICLRPDSGHSRTARQVTDSCISNIRYGV